MDFEIELLKIKTTIEITLLKLELFVIELKIFIHNITWRENLSYFTYVLKMHTVSGSVSKKVLVK